ncbi:MAG: hypothetical protein ABEH81_04230 [Halopenitus sp.]
MFSTVTPAILVDTDTEIVDGRITVSATGESSLYVSAPEQRPLGSDETHLRLKVAGNGTETVVELDADALDELSNAITEARKSFTEDTIETFDPADYDDVREALQAAPNGYGVEKVIDHFDPIVDEGEGVTA